MCRRKLELLVGRTMQSDSPDQRASGGFDVVVQQQQQQLQLLSSEGPTRHAFSPTPSLHLGADILEHRVSGVWSSLH